ncbi:MAG: hypothetical protein ACRD2L_12860, partial [Terriglobia bacterium]
LQEDMIVDALAIVVAHEIGHIGKRHKPSALVSRATSRAQEAEADEYARVLVRKSGFSTLPSLATVYLMFAALEGDSEDGTHPHPLCRIYRIGRAEFEDLRKEPAAINNLKRLGMDPGSLAAQYDSFAKYCNL